VTGRKRVLLIAASILCGSASPDHSLGHASVYACSGQGRRIGILEGRYVTRFILGVDSLQMPKKFTLYAIYSLANSQWEEDEQFDLSRLPFDIAEGVRIEDVSQFILGDTFKFLEKRVGSDQVEALQRTRYALVHRFDAEMTIKNGEVISTEDYIQRSEQLVRKVAACLRLIRPMRQSSSFMRGNIRNDGTFDVESWQSPADLVEVPEVQMLFQLRNRDADDLRTYTPLFLRAMGGNFWKFKMSVDFHELGHWADKGELLKARYLLWAAAIESIYTSHHVNHQGSKAATARIRWFLGENTSIYGPGEMSDLLTDPNITIGSVVDDLYKIRNYIAHGDRIPDRYLRETVRHSFGGPVCAYAMLFEAQSCIIRTTLLKVLRDGLLNHFANASSAEAYFGAQGLTRDKLTSRKS
jgi:hypothetical protein